MYINTSHYQQITYYMFMASDDKEIFFMFFPILCKSMKYITTSAPLNLHIFWSLKFGHPSKV